MKFFIKNLIFVILFSCASRDIKTSKFAKINDKNEYENNYINYEKKSINKTKFLSFFFKNIFNQPEKVFFPLVNINKKVYQDNVSLLTWSGHSTFLFQKHNFNILIDPHLSGRASPFSFLGPKRYTPSVFKKDNLPRIDIVAISHNHYDHLDLKSLKIIYEKSPKTIFLVPLGDKKLLIKNGLKNVIEFDWWESYETEHLKFVFTPVQHWSKRTFLDRNKSLWGGWWIESKDFKFLHLGDTGYTKDFIDIKKKLGSPDLVAIPIGAYSPRSIMKFSHLDPDEALQAFVDLDAKAAVGMHWGTFILSQEPVDEPIKIIKKQLKKYNIKEKNFMILRHGESLSLDKL